MACTCDSCLAARSAAGSYKAFGGEMAGAWPFPAVPDTILSAYPPSVQLAARTPAAAKAAVVHDWCSDPFCPDCYERSQAGRLGPQTAKMRGSRPGRPQRPARQSATTRKAELKRMLYSGNPSARAFALAELERQRQAPVNKSASDDPDFIAFLRQAGAPPATRYALTGQV